MNGEKKSVTWKHELPLEQYMLLGEATLHVLGRKKDWSKHGSREKISLKSQTFVNNSNIIIESPLDNLGGEGTIHTYLKEIICYKQKRW